MRVAVLGTGGMGSCVAADLVSAGHDVVLIDQWPAHVAAMQADGLRVKGRDRELHVPVRAFHLCDVRTFTEPFDVVFLATKAYDTRWSCTLIEPVLASDGVIVGVQNAMTADDVRDVVGAHRTFGCVPELSSEVLEPGVVARARPPEHTSFQVGSLDGSTDDDRLQAVAALLGAAGRVTVSPAILAAKWTKLVLNAMVLGPPALVGLGPAAAAGLPGMRDLFRRIGHEAMGVGDALGYRMQPIFGMTEAEADDRVRVCDTIYEKVVGFLGDTGLRNAVLQDHVKGRYSEVDLINGLVVEEGRRHAIECPANAAVVDLSARIFRREFEPDPANLARIQQLLADRDPT